MKLMQHIVADRNQFQITSCNSGRSLNIHTVTLSQKSDAFLGSSYSYAGFIIYQYHGRSNWITQNGTRCECGYLAIQRTDSEKIKRLQSGTPWCCSRRSVQECIWRRYRQKQSNRRRFFDTKWFVQSQFRCL